MSEHADMLRGMVGLIMAAMPEGIDPNEEVTIKMGSEFCATLLSAMDAGAAAIDAVESVATMSYSVRGMGRQ